MMGFSSFASRVFAAMLVVAVGTVSLVCVSIYHTSKREKEAQYFARYASLGEILGAAFRQLEGTADQAGRSALHTLSEIEDRRGIPDARELDALADSLGVHGFYVINREGRFIRSSSRDVGARGPNLFAACPEYRNLLRQPGTVQSTPIIEGRPYQLPQKFTLMANKRGSLILESAIDLHYVGDTLREIIRDDANILSVALSAPDGSALGSIGGCALHGERAGAASAKEIWVGRRVLDEHAVFSMQVPASVSRCCECKAKGVGVDEAYFYLLRLEVSLHPLVVEIAALRRQVIGLFVLSLAASLVLAHLLTRKLVVNLERISATANAIVDAEDLQLRVAVPEGDDEVSRLATSFNHMVHNLQVSQARLVQSTRLHSIATLASEVAHDIRSPLMALDAVSRHLTTLPQQHRQLLIDATGRINDIADNLLRQYRKAHSEQTASPSLQDALLGALVHGLVAEKRAQFATRQIDFIIDIDAVHEELRVRVDPAGFQRALSNLLNNAAESIAERGTVSVTVDRISETARLQIVDTGCGIPDDKLQAVLQGGVSLGKGGHGIGLCSAIRTIESWRGSCSLSSRVGRGTRVTILLPAV